MSAELAMRRLRRLSEADLSGQDVGLEEWNRAVMGCHLALICEVCAAEGRLVKLAPWMLGNTYVRSGRWCPRCEEGGFESPMP